MRLNLLVNNPAEVRSGYVNVDPYAPAVEAAGGVVRCQLHDLSPLADANEADEIVAKDVLDTYPATQADRVLAHWLSRLAHGGRLTVSVVDAREVSRYFLANLHENTSLETFNRLVHGEQDAPGRFRQCSLTLDQLVAVLVSKGMKIISKRVSEFRAVVTAERP